MSIKHAPFTVSPAGYQLPARITIGPVTLQIADLARSLAYYQNVVGLRVISQNTTSASLGAEGSETPLVILKEKRGAKAVPPRGRIGLYHFAILLPDRIALGRFLAHLGRLNEYAGMSDHLVSEALYLTDPDGLGIEVYADRSREIWRVDGSALAMATDPLNARELLSASASGTWNGAPAGTRLGHVHLYVDSLETSERFFHRALGLDKVTLQFPGALFLSAGGYHHHLGTNTWAAGAPLAGDDDARLLEWSIGLPSITDVKDAEQSLVAAGFSAEWDREEQSAVITDPWGTKLRIAVGA